jgi:DNA-binding MarR family transcriptional regulator
MATLNQINTPGPQTFDLLLRRLSSLLQRRIAQHFPDHELSYLQWTALTHVRDDEDATAGNLARQLGITGSTATRLVDWLQERGLIERVRSATDRRFVFLSLTPAGAARLRGARSMAVLEWDELVEGVEPAELDRVARVLERLAMAFDAATPD